MGKINVIMADPDGRGVRSCGWAGFDDYEPQRAEEVARGITHLEHPLGIANTLCGISESPWPWIDAPRGAAVTCSECWKMFSAIRSARGIKGVER
jgi:hypothetical protein